MEMRVKNNRLVPVSTPGIAEGVAYDNDTSGLSADNVQDGIDEIATIIKGISYDADEEMITIPATIGTYDSNEEMIELAL